MQFFVPFVVVPFNVFVLRDDPNRFVHNFFTANIVAPVIFVFVLVPYTIRHFFVSVLNVEQ